MRRVAAALVNCRSSLQAGARSHATACFAALALFALLAGDAASQYSVFDWIWRWETRALLSLVMGAIALLLAAVGTMAFLSLMHSYGKVLVRIERLESALAEAGIDLGLEPGALDASTAPGAPAPAIGVVGATGEKISLAELWGSGTPVMQLFGLLAILHALTPNWSNGEMRVHVADHNIKFDHLPVYADFVFGGTGGGDGGGEMPILGVRIASLLANPEGVNQGREDL